MEDSSTVATPDIVLSEHEDERFNTVSQDILAILQSTAKAFLQNISLSEPKGFTLPGIFVYKAMLSPITLFHPREDGRVSIGLTADQTFWCQFAFQFAHELCHVVIGHLHRSVRPYLEASQSSNDWLEESLCELASLYTLKSMAIAWAVSPPYPNWLSYRCHLDEYARERLETSQACWDENKYESLSAFIAKHESRMRSESCIRELNNLVALKLFPIFERCPQGWDTLRYYKLIRLEPTASLEARLLAWQETLSANGEDDWMHQFVDTVRTELCSHRATAPPPAAAPPPGPVGPSPGSHSEQGDALPPVPDTNVGATEPSLCENVVSLQLAQHTQPPHPCSPVTLHPVDNTHFASVVSQLLGRLGTPAIIALLADLSGSEVSVLHHIHYDDLGSLLDTPRLQKREIVARLAGTRPSTPIREGPGGSRASDAAERPTSFVQGVFTHTAVGVHANTSFAALRQMARSECLAWIRSPAAADVLLAVLRLALGEEEGEEKL